MNKLVLIIILATWIGYPILAQVGEMFPDMPAETVEDVVVEIPADTNGKYTLLGLAYSKKSEGDLQGWYSPVYNKFIPKKEGEGGLFAGFGYDVNVYFIPMFTGVKAAAEGTAKRKAIDNIDERLLPHILFYKGQLDPYKEKLDFEKKDIPYFFVLDAEGKIVHATSGKFTESKLDLIEEAIEDF